MELKLYLFGFMYRSLRVYMYVHELKRHVCIYNLNAIESISCLFGISVFLARVNTARESPYGSAPLAIRTDSATHTATHTRHHTLTATHTHCNTHRSRLWSERMDATGEIFGHCNTYCYTTHTHYNTPNHTATVCGRSEWMSPATSPDAATHTATHTATLHTHTTPQPHRNTHCNSLSSERMSAAGEKS